MKNQYIFLLFLLCATSIFTSEELIKSIRDAAGITTSHPTLLQRQLQRQQQELDRLRAQQAEEQKQLADLQAQLEGERTARSASRERRRAEYETERADLHARLEAAEARTREELDHERRERAASTERHLEKLEQEKLTHKERAAMAHEEILSRKLEHQQLKEQLAGRRFTDVVRRRLLEKRNRELIEQKENVLKLTHELELAKLKIEDFENAQRDTLTALNQLRDPVINPFYDTRSTIYNKALHDHVDPETHIPLLPSTRSIQKFKHVGPETTRYTIQLDDSFNKKTHIIILKIVHGTFSSDKVYSEDPNLIKSIMIFAQQLALAYGSIVHVDFFKWSGALDKTDRINHAGTSLANNLKTDVEKIYQDKLTPIIWVIAHSHGCNVTHNAAQHLKKLDYYVNDKVITIHNAILCASPAFDIDPRETKTKTHNILNIIHFYGRADTTAQMGSRFEMVTQGSRQSLLRKKHSITIDEWVRNIRVKLNGYDTNHLNIVDVVVRYLADILQTLGKDFPMHYDLEMNIFAVSIPDSDESEGAPDRLFYWRPKFAVAATDLTNLMLTDYPQYTHAVSKDLLNVFQQSASNSLQTNTIFTEIYKRSIYDYSPLGAPWGETSIYGFGDMHDIPHKVDILYNDSFDRTFSTIIQNQNFYESASIPSPDTTSRPTSPETTTSSEAPKTAESSLKSTNEPQIDLLTRLARFIGWSADQKSTQPPALAQDVPKKPRGPLVAELTKVFEPHNTAGAGTAPRSGAGGAAGGGGKGKS